MVMRHFGGGIGHLQSTHHVQRGEHIVAETASISSSQDEESSGACAVVMQDVLDEGDDAEDLGGLDDSLSESGTVSSSSGDSDEDESESELDTDDNGYDSL